MLSSQNGVLGKIRNEIGNAKLLSQHCCPHRLVLASKAGQHLLPDWIEKNCSLSHRLFQRQSLQERRVSEVFTTG